METLKLMALDETDLSVISAHAQDALSKPTLISFSPAKKNFTLVINRFAWDAAGKKRRGAKFERRRAALSFSGVTGVRSKGIKKDNDDQVLSLMALRFVASDEPTGTLELVFAEDVAIALDVECIEVRLTDLGAAWESKFKPRHPGA